MRNPARLRLDDPVSAINVTPLVDVMLVLLVIFMVVTATEPWTATLPQARTALPEADARVTLAIDRAGGFWVADGPRRARVADGALAGELAAAYASRPGDHVLYLKADREVSYGRVLTAMDAARAAGVRRVGTITTAPR